MRQVPISFILQQIFQISRRWDLKLLKPNGNTVAVLVLILICGHFFLPIGLW